MDSAVVDKASDHKVPSYTGVGVCWSSIRSAAGSWWLTSSLAVRRCPDYSPFRYARIGTTLTLLVDPLEASLDGTPRRRVEATEYSCLHDLQRLYEHGRRDPDCLLRLFHVQNAPWATRYLLKKFGIDQRSDIVGTDFANYVRQKRAERRGGRPFPTAQTWPLKQDPWRGICKTAFGFDYLGAHLITEVQEPRDSADNDKIMGLHCFDEHGKPSLSPVLD